VREDLPDLSPLALPAYLTGAMLVLVPFGEAFFSTFPMEPGSAMWRFGAVGIMSSALLTPLLGLLILVTTSAILEHPLGVRLVGGVTLVAGVILLLVLGLFVLDAVQIRAQVVEEARASYQMAAGQTIFRLLAVMVTSVVMGIFSWRFAPELRRSAARRSRRSAPVVGSQ